MSYLLEDDATTIEDIRVALEGITNTRDTQPNRTVNLSERITGLSNRGVGSIGASFPFYYPIRALGNVGLQTVNIDLALQQAHIHTMTVTGNITLAFNNPPASSSLVIRAATRRPIESKAMAPTNAIRKRARYEPSIRVSRKYFVPA